MGKFGRGSRCAVVDLCTLRLSSVLGFSMSIGGDALDGLSGP